MSILQSILDQVKSSDLEHFKTEIEKKEDAARQNLIAHQENNLEDIMRSRIEKLGIVAPESAEPPHKKEVEAKPLEEVTDDVFKKFIDSIRG